MSDEYSKCPICGTTNYSNHYMLRLIDLTSDELEQIDEYLKGYDMIEIYDYEIVSNMLCRDIDNEEIEICNECGGELNGF